MKKLLSVATASVFAEQLADHNHCCFPRVDYLELQNLLHAETMDYSSYDKRYAGKALRYMETQLRSDIFLATITWLRSHKYPVVFTWSERAGIPFAIYKRLTQTSSRFVTMFQCWSHRQELAITKFNLFSVMDNIIVHCTSMRDNLVRLGAQEDKIKIIHYSIDQSFFSPLPDITPQKNLIMSIGEPRSRDYDSLFRAVDGLPVNLKLPAYGHWYAREKNNSLHIPIPANVSLLKHLAQVELRKLYASSQFVILPLRDLVYSAGATATLEAGSMARAVIAFRSEGITDYIIDGETGILVESGNAAELRNAIQFLLANPTEAKRLGENARQRIEESLCLEKYVRNIADLLNQNIS